MFSSTDFIMLTLFLFFLGTTIPSSLDWIKQKNKNHKLNNPSAFVHTIREPSTVTSIGEIEVGFKPAFRRQIM